MSNNAQFRVTDALRRTVPKPNIVDNFQANAKIVWKDNLGPRLDAEQMRGGKSRDTSYSSGLCLCGRMGGSHTVDILLWYNPL